MKIQNKKRLVIALKRIKKKKKRAPKEMTKQEQAIAMGQTFKKIRQDSQYGRIIPQGHGERGRC